MAYLLDTHTLLWYHNGDSQLSVKAKEILDNTDVQKYFSIASFWEIAIKISVKKLRLDYSFNELHEKIVVRNIPVLNININHTETISNLPLHHRDLFDRMIIAQSITEDLTIISKDKNFSLYPIKLLW